MSDTRSREQRREDALNQAYVRRRAEEERAAAWTDAQKAAHRAGRAAGLAGWSVRGTPGMEHHESALSRAELSGCVPEWTAGYREGAALRAIESRA